MSVSRPCPIYAALLSEFPVEAESGQLSADIQELFTTIVGRRFSATIVSEHSPRSLLARVYRAVYRHVGLLNRFTRLERFGHEPVSLSSFYTRGAGQAERIIPFVQGRHNVLEYGGGIGRLGTHVAAHVGTLVSCDISPLARKYGRVLSPNVEFVMLDELGDSPRFDFAYSVAVFFHLDDDAQRSALKYVHKCLRPGGCFLVDLKLGQIDVAMTAANGWVRTTPESAFISLLEEFFAIEEVELFNRAFLCTKGYG